MSFFSLTVSAQSGSVFNKFGEKNRSDRSNTTMIGLKVGVVMPRVSYNSAEFKGIPQKMFFKPAFGLFVEFPLTSSLSVAPELLYASRGVNHDNFLYREVDTASYVLTANYIDLRIPLVYRFKVNDFFQPYIFMAADMAFCMNATADYTISGVSYGSGQLNVPLHYKRFDISALLGLGFRLNFNFRRFTLTTKLDVGYNIGFVNTFGKEVPNVVDPDLKRRNRPIECMLSIGVPLKFSQPDACLDFNQKYDRYY